MNNFTIPFVNPKRLPEANVQAELYSRLRNAGVNIMLEYRCAISSMNSNIRMDIAVIQGKRIICAIECKSRAKNKHVNIQSRQHHKYLSIGIPFIYCLSMGEVESCYKQVIDFYFKGKPFKEGVSSYNVYKRN